MASTEIFGKVIKIGITENGKDLSRKEAYSLKISQLIQELSSLSKYSEYPNKISFFLFGTAIIVNRMSKFIAIDTAQMLKTLTVGPKINTIPNLDFPKKKGNKKITKKILNFNQKSNSNSITDDVVERQFARNNRSFEDMRNNLTMLGRNSLVPQSTDRKDDILDKIQRGDEEDNYNLISALEEFGAHPQLLPDDEMGANKNLFEKLYQEPNDNFLEDPLKRIHENVTNEGGLFTQNLINNYNKFMDLPEKSDMLEKEDAPQGESRQNTTKKKIKKIKIDSKPETMTTSQAIGKVLEENEVGLSLLQNLENMKKQFLAANNSSLNTSNIFKTSIIEASELQNMFEEAANYNLEDDFALKIKDWSVNEFISNRKDYSEIRVRGPEGARESLSANRRLDFDIADSKSDAGSKHSKSSAKSKDGFFQIDDFFDLPNQDLAIITENLNEQYTKTDNIVSSLIQNPDKITENLRHMKEIKKKKDEQLQSFKDLLKGTKSFSLNSSYISAQQVLPQEKVQIFLNTLDFAQDGIFKLNQSKVTYGSIGDIYISY